MDTLDQILENLWDSDYVQKNPTKSYKTQYNSEYLAIAQYMSGGTRPANTTNYSKMGRVLVGLEDNIRAGTTPEPEPDPITNMLPASKVVIESGEIAAWMICDSPTTQQAPVGDPNGDKHNIVAWAPSSPYLTSPPRYAPPQKMYALHGIRVIQGIPGRMIDYHTAPSDKPHGWALPAYPGDPNRTGVASLAIDYWANADGLQVICQAEDWSPYDPGSGDYHYKLLSHAEMQQRLGQWIWIWMEVVWGAQWMPHQGSVRAWLAGEDAPRVEAFNINTHWFEQHFSTLWEGGYNSNGMPSRAEVEVAARRIGKTPQECFNDKPVVFVRAGKGQLPGNPGTITTIPNVDGGKVPVPASLRW